MQTASLYERLGGAEGIPPLVEGIVEAHMENPVIAPRFLPYRDQPEKLAELKQHLARFLAQGSGGPAKYAGRSMPEAHHGLNISAGEYMAAIDDIMEVMDEHGLDEETRKDVLSIVYSLKPEIVGL